MWQARSGVVPFTKVAGDIRYLPYIEAVCRTLIGREERFAKTSVGWLLRDVSRHEPDWVKRFVEQHLAHFSVESVRNATKYFGKPEQKRLLDHVKKAGPGLAE